MTSSSSTTPANISKFQDLLRELFQFDCADLDFGIYRIMNHKRDAVERFINEQLPATIATELDSGPLAQQAQAQASLAEIAQQVSAALGEDAIDENGDLVSAHHDLPIGRKYLEAQKQAAGSRRSRDAVEAAIYNHLYTFFSRYYEEGDFISKRRYSRNQRYAIPYNGEEVYLHWANNDQYYVKSDEYFRNYDWNAPNGVTVHFRLKNADVEQNNVKGERRFFIPLVSETAWDAGGSAITIPFEYRPLSDSEKATYVKSNKQDAVVEAAAASIPKRVPANSPAQAALISELTMGEETVSQLAHHLRQYVRRNNSDFFIHKDLSGFLNRELDFYLKNEVLNLDDLVSAGQNMYEGWFQQLRLTKAVGSKIIEFLAQIEGFQKMLWEKRKFVTETQYCVRVGIVNEAFYTDIAECDAQWEEWGELYALDISDRSETFLRAHPTLMLDTKHFEQKFVDKLLANLDLEVMTDGLLIRGENWQALNLMQECYRERVKSIYIDPPYNTDASSIIYKNGYKDSTWLSMLRNSLLSARALLQTDGILCCAIDDEEAWRLRAIMQAAFEKELGIAPVRSNPAGRKSSGQFSPSHEYAFFFGMGQSVPGVLQKTDKELKRYPFSDKRGLFAWNNLIRHGSNDRREDAPTMFYPIYVSVEDALRVPRMEWNDAGGEYTILEESEICEDVVWPVRGDIQKNWHRGWERIGPEQDEYRVRRDQGTISIDFKIRMDEKSMPKTWWDRKEYASSNHGARTLKNLFLENPFDFPKSVVLVEDCIRASDGNGGVFILDYFAGSGTTGHAVINLNREDGGQRKFVLVEMGDHFATVLLPRIKKVIFAPEWKEGKPKRRASEEEAARSPRIVKYLRLESYEDALDSIEFEQSSDQMELADAADEYLLKYMLKWETKGSETLLNVAKLASPFCYRLRVHVNGERQERNVDLAETFNFLLGLNVRKREVHNENGRRYLVYRGETRDRPGHKVAVIWRQTEAWTEADFMQDRDFVTQQILAAPADTVYVNGDSAIPDAKAIEPLFKARMFAGVYA